MNISYNWLKDLVKIDLNPQEIAEKLTSVGLAVEGIEPHGDDFVFDIDLTSNRGDCLSHLGVARELSAITGSKLKREDTEGQKSNTENQTFVTIEEPNICHRFTGRIIRNVKIGPSPKWLVDRLEAVGERSINNVADITNYVMHELGNPMHSFDYNALAGNKLIVRRARSGEKMNTLDEIERNFTEEMLLICDAEKPVAIAGIMGGQFSGITDETTNVLLEVAYFTRESIRETSRKLKLNTEASHHFERGVDIENLVRASNRATQLICELAGGIAGEFIDLYPTKRIDKSVSFNYDKVKKLTGLEISDSEIERILNALGIEKKSEQFTIPSWRHDISIEEDLVEEVARIVGLNNIKEELPPAFSAGEYQPTEIRKRNLRNTLSTLGFDEAISYSFVEPKYDDTFEFVPDLVAENLDEKFVTLQDSIIEGAVRMRASLLSNLIHGVRTNLNYGTRNVKLFELGKVFANASNTGDLPIEKELFAMVLTGGEVEEDKAFIARELDFYDAKGSLETAIESLDLPSLEFAASDVRHLQKGQSAEVLANGKRIGTIGRLNDEISSAHKFKQPVFVAELDLQTLLAQDSDKIFYQPLPKYPSISRDVSLLVKRNLAFAEIVGLVKSLGVKLCQNVDFVDVYEGKGISDDERSITVRFEYRDSSRTLTEEIVEPEHRKILDSLVTKLGVKERF
jgi:phenylalanyl-tRNA synthetase beta chain